MARYLNMDGITSATGAMFWTHSFIPLIGLDLHTEIVIRDTLPETITVLQYRLKAAQEELAAFQSGEKYIRMEKQHLTQVRAPSF